MNTNSLVEFRETQLPKDIIFKKMKQASLNTQFIFLLALLIFTSSCNSQLSGKDSHQSVSNDSTATSLRVDSVLQFSLMITSILEDSKGNFWFGTHGDGLCRYDGKQFTYFTADNGLPGGKMREFAPGTDWSNVRKINGGNQIGSIQEDKNGDIWLMTIDHVCKFNGKTFSIVQVDSEGSLSTDLSAEEWKTELDYLWIGLSNRLGLYRYNGSKLEFMAFPFPYSSPRDGVSEVYLDKDGNMWLGTMENGTFRYDGKSFTQINKKDEIGICRSVFQDNTGRIWITNNRFGLNYLEGDTLINFIEEYSLINNDEAIKEEFGTGFQAIEQDKNGDIWFGTFGNGLWRYDGKKLTHYNSIDTLPIGISKTIYKDKNGELWFGLNEGSVYGFNGIAFYRFDGMEN